MEIRKNKYHGLLRDEKIEDFNQAVQEVDGRVDLSNCNFRGVNLRTANLKTADLRNSYFKQADLRGADLSQAKLDGASFHKARIAGVLFPLEVNSGAIRNSYEYGTRIRVRTEL